MQAYILWSQDVGGAAVVQPVLESRDHVRCKQFGKSSCQTFPILSHVYILCAFFFFFNSSNKSGGIERGCATGMNGTRPPVREVSQRADEHRNQHPIKQI